MVGHAVCPCPCLQVGDLTFDGVGVAVLTPVRAPHARDSPPLHSDERQNGVEAFALRKGVAAHHNVPHAVIRVGRRHVRRLRGVRTAHRAPSGVDAGPDRAGRDQASVKARGAWHRQMLRKITEGFGGAAEGPGLGAHAEGV